MQPILHGIMTQLSLNDNLGLCLEKVMVLEWSNSGSADFYIRLFTSENLSKMYFPKRGSKHCILTVEKSDINKIHLGIYIVS